MEKNKQNEQELEEPSYYIQQLGFFLSRIYNSKNSGSLLMIKLNKQPTKDSEYYYYAINKIKKYKLGHIGEIRNFKNEDHIIMAHESSLNTKKGINNLIKEIEIDLFKKYSKDEFKIKGILYKGEEEMNTVQTIENMINLL